MISKEEFIELWNKHLEPHFADGRLTWECSPLLEEHLKNVGDWNYSDDEIMELIEAGEL